MPKKVVPHAPADKVALYEKLVALDPEIPRKGAANPYTSLNGHMFSFLTKTGTLGLRLSAEQREAFIKKYKTELCVHYNTVMKEYVAVPDALLKKTAELNKYFKMSVEYTSSLKPRPTTKKKAPVKK